MACTYCPSSGMTEHFTPTTMNTAVAHLIHHPLGRRSQNNQHHFLVSHRQRFHQRWPVRHARTTRICSTVEEQPHTRCMPVERASHRRASHRPRLSEVTLPMLTSSRQGDAMQCTLLCGCAKNNNQPDHGKMSHPRIVAMRRAVLPCTSGASTAVPASSAA